MGTVQHNASSLLQLCHLEEGLEFGTALIEILCKKKKDTNEKKSEILNSFRLGTQPIMEIAVPNDMGNYF